MSCYDVISILILFQYVILIEPIMYILGITFNMENNTIIVFQGKFEGAFFPWNILMESCSFISHKID